MSNKMSSMKLKSWIKAEHGRAMALARFIDVPQSFVSKMCSGEKAIPAQHCKAIEAFSEGEVTCIDMRPDDWHKYWPELAPAQSHQAQPATHDVANGV